MKDDKGRRKKTKTKLNDDDEAARNIMISLLATHDPNSRRNAIGGVILMNMK